MERDPAEPIVSVRSLTIATASGTTLLSVDKLDIFWRQNRDHWSQRLRKNYVVACVVWGDDAGNRRHR